MDNLKEPPPPKKIKKEDEVLPGPSGNQDVSKQGPDLAPAAEVLNSDSDTDTAAGVLDKLHMKAVVELTPIEDHILKETPLHSDNDTS